jgi:protein gp37
MLNYLAAITGDEQRGEDFYAAMDDYNIEYDLLKQGWPLPNVWLGVSCEDQVTLDARVPLLLDTPASVRWVSFEPLLGPINLRGRPHSDLCIRCGKPSAAYHDHPDGYRTRGLDWVIVGGESGPDARPCDVAWVRDIVRQCKTSDVPAFVKQMGSNAYLDVRQNKTLPGWRRAFRDRKGADPEEWPIDLRVGEFPR